MNREPGAAIEVQQLSKSFARGKTALDGVSLRIEPGEMVALIGASGSGKSTLIRHIAGLVEGDRSPDAACCVTVLGETVQREGRIGRNAAKVRTRVGVIFQQFNLVNRLSVLTNVLIGFLGRIPAARGSCCLFTRSEKQRAIEALARVGIAETAKQRASTLSGGQQQRAAIARALVQEAEVILADEPIASLDPNSSRRVMEMLACINREDGITVVVSLHQVEYAAHYCPRTIALRDGRIVFDGESQALTLPFLQQLYGDSSEELILAPIAATSEGVAAAGPPAMAVA